MVYLYPRGRDKCKKLFRQLIVDIDIPKKQAGCITVAVGKTQPGNLKLFLVQSEKKLFHAEIALFGNQLKEKVALPVNMIGAGKGNTKIILQLSQAGKKTDAYLRLKNAFRILHVNYTVFRYIKPGCLRINNQFFFLWFCVIPYHSAGIFEVKHPFFPVCFIHGFNSYVLDKIGLYVAGFFISILCLSD